MNLLQTYGIIFLFLAMASFFALLEVKKDMCFHIGWLFLILGIALLFLGVTS